MSKGSKRRPEDSKKYEESWVKIFGTKPKKQPKISKLKNK